MGKGLKWLAFAVMVTFTSHAMAKGCNDKLFSVTVDSQLTIGDVVENLAETCGLTVIVADESAKQRMKKKLYYVQLNNVTLRSFLNTILKDNDLYYTLEGNKLKISYLVTRTFKVHYIAGDRSGKSNAHVTIANSNNAVRGLPQGGTGGINQQRNNQGGSSGRTGISIESNDEFRFWSKVKEEIQRILSSAADDSVHYTKTGNGWVGPDGKVWEYNPLEPIVNPEAGMITVTGTQKQIARVARYIQELEKQLKTQVLIDVRILSVEFDDSKTTGVDWSQLFALQDFTVNSLVMARNNVESATYELERGITEFTPGNNDSPPNASAIILNGNTQVSEIVKFLGTQGEVKSISSPRVMTLNNQPALISVGRELFYKITSATTASGQGGAVAAQGEQVDSVFAGILLDITPEIDDEGTITLKINPSISDTVNTITTQNGTARDIPPDLIRRQIASVIKVKDGQHAILGGLISSKRGTRIKKIPLLGDLPLLEHAFKSEEQINRVEELVIIITPHIVRNSKSVSLKDLGYERLNEK